MTSIKTLDVQSNQNNSLNPFWCSLISSANHLEKRRCHKPLQLEFHNVVPFKSVEALKEKFRNRIGRKPCRGLEAQQPPVLAVSPTSPLPPPSQSPPPTITPTKAAVILHSHLSKSQPTSSRSLRILFE